MKKKHWKVCSASNITDNEKPDLVFQTSVYLPEKYHSCTNKMITALILNSEKQFTFLVVSNGND